MSLQEGYPIIHVKAIRSDTASTDAAIVPIPNAGSGYTVRRITVYKSRLESTGATANGATATLSVRGGAGASGTSIVADAALTGLTGSTIVLDRTVAATGISPIVTDANLYFRIGTASGVAGSVFDAVIEYSPLP